jgi:hypothetical protein
MVVMNSNEEAVTIPRDRLAEILDHFASGTHVINGEIINLNNDFEVPAKTTGIWELGF